ncbi:MAG: Oligopeptidase A [Parcubacteria group bacterium GW2011_GWA2_47_7]|nr:MAG: Oligopeptidase A [Parcubacteria group bacterium GW2011_GWA2_47_7]
MTDQLVRCHFTERNMMKYDTEIHVGTDGTKSFLTLPDFSTFNPEAAVTELEALFTEGRNQADVAAQTDVHTFASLIEVAEEFGERLQRVYGPLSHLDAAMQTTAVKKAHEKAVALYASFGSDMGMHKGLYLAHKRYQAGGEYKTLSEEQKKIVDDAILDFELSGVALPEKEKRQLKKLDAKAAKRGARFGNNLKAAMQLWKKYITDENQLSGIPVEIKEAMREAAIRSRRKGYQLSLQSSIVFSVLSHADNRHLRKEVFVASAAKASDIGPRPDKLDNRPVMNDILRIEYARARLLGVNDYAELSLRKKMADSPAQVFVFLRELAAKAHKRAHNDFEELEEFAKKKLGISPLLPWDIAYACEKLKKEKCGVSENELRPYLTATKVFAGLFGLVERLYGLTIKEDIEVAKPSVWDPSVRFFRVYDKSGFLRAAFHSSIQRQRGSAHSR